MQGSRLQNKKSEKLTTDLSQGDLQSSAVEKVDAAISCDLIGG